LEPGFGGLALLTPKVTHQKHSGLGMGSFIIALLVGGLDLILAVAIVTGIATSASGPRPNSADNLKAEMMAGGMAMVCLNCMSVPVCLVGLGLAIVGLIGHRDRNHLFTWIGLFGNGVVVLAILGLFVLGTVLGR
jgi:hypothetical protein